MFPVAITINVGKFSSLAVVVVVVMAGALSTTGEHGSLGVNLCEG